MICGTFNFRFHTDFFCSLISIVMLRWPLLQSQHQLPVFTTASILPNFLLMWSLPHRRLQHVPYSTVFVRDPYARTRKEFRSSWKSFGSRVLTLRTGNDLHVRTDNELYVSVLIYIIFFQIICAWMLSACASKRTRRCMRIVIIDVYDANCNINQRMFASLLDCVPSNFGKWILPLHWQIVTHLMCPKFCAKLA